MKNKLPEDFYPLVASTAQKLRNAKLTASEWTIWSYLVEIDPWGNRYHEVETLEVMEKCKVSKATYYRAIAKFQDNEIFDFQDKGFNVRNLQGTYSLKNEKTVSEMRQLSQKTESQNCENSLKNEKTVSEMRQLSQNCENHGSKVAPSKDSETPKISLDLKDQLDRSDQDDFLNFENTDATLRAASSTEIAKTTPQGIDDSSPDYIDGLANMPTDSTTTINGDLFRRRVEDFILKSLKLSPRDRIAYFSRFTPENWQDWEAKYKANLTQPSSMYKPFVPEQVEIASPDSPAVQDAIAEIRKSLGIKA
jgi:hypothetical protein